MPDLDERDLLARLSALKSATPARRQPATKLPLPRGTIPLADPRQGVLDDRLRALRNQSPADHPPQSQPQPQLQPRPQTVEELEGEGEGEGEEEKKEEDALGSDAGDGFDFDPDEALEDMLNDLELDLDESGGGDDDDDAAAAREQPAPPRAATEEPDEASTARRIEAVLARIQMDPSFLPKHKDGSGGGGGGGGGVTSAQHHPNPDPSEEENREVDRVVSRALDELKADDENSSDDRKVPPPPGGGSPFPDFSSLPRLPGASPNGRPDAGPPAEPGEEEDLSSSDLDRRLAALRALSGAGDGASPAPPATLDDTARYTDEDQQGWCIVCLEDGTTVCVGCDGDVFCDPCWRDMHLGPDAAFEPSHRRKAFVRDRKEKRRLLAA